MTEPTPDADRPEPGTIASAEAHLARIANYNPAAVAQLPASAKLQLLALQATADAQIAQARALEALFMVASASAQWQGESIFDATLARYAATLVHPNGE